MLCEGDKAGEVAERFTRLGTPIQVVEAQRQMQHAGVSPLVTSAVEQLFARTASLHSTTPYTGQGIESALEWLAVSADA